MLDKSTIDLVNTDTTLEQLQDWIHKEIAIIVNDSIINLKYVVSIKQVK